MISIIPGIIRPATGSGYAVSLKGSGTREGVRPSSSSAAATGGGVATATIRELRSIG